MYNNVMEGREEGGDQLGFGVLIITGWPTDKTHSSVYMRKYLQLIEN